MKTNYKHYDAFSVINSLFMLLLTLLCLLPVLNVLAISFSDRGPVASGRVSFFPVQFTTAAYEYVLRDRLFLKSLITSLTRVFAGTAINLSLIVLSAYPLSKPESRFHARRIYMWLFLFSTLFNGGLIPTYMVVNKMGLINSFWSMVIPGAVPVAYMIMMMNYFRSLPKELEESARIDGANQWQILTQVYLPLSKASLATITLFCIVNHWNSWFDGMIYFNRAEGQPLATYLHNLVVNTGLDVMAATTDVGTLNQLMKISNQTIKSAQIFLAMLPILIVYPFMRKFFAKGIMIGSVKG